MITQDYRKTRGIHRIGLAAARPLASEVLEGTLYFSTDTFVLERSNGIIWEPYSGVVTPPAPVAWVDVPYNPANFTCTGGTWTVPQNAQLDYSYCMLGPTVMFISVNLSITTVTAGITDLKIKIPNGKTATKFKLGYGRFTNAQTGFERRELIGLAFVHPGFTSVTVLPVRLANEYIQPLIAGDNDVAFQLMLEVN